MYQRTVHEWERQRLRLEFEHGELLSRVNYLSEEVNATFLLGYVPLKQRRLYSRSGLASPNCVYS